LLTFLFKYCRSYSGGNTKWVENSTLGMFALWRSLEWNWWVPIKVQCIRVPTVKRYYSSEDDRSQPTVASSQHYYLHRDCGNICKTKTRRPTCDEHREERVGKWGWRHSLVRIFSWWPSNPYNDRWYTCACRLSFQNQYRSISGVCFVSNLFLPHINDTLYLPVDAPDNPFPMITVFYADDTNLIKSTV